jgi:hypothetical protein
MSSEHYHEHDPQHLLQVKDALHNLWKELPAEHQATMLLVLLKEIRDRDYQIWVLDAIQRLYLSKKGANGVG